MDDYWHNYDLADIHERRSKLPKLKKIYVMDIIRQTEKAVLLSTKHGEHWVPKSQIHKVCDNYILISKRWHKQKIKTQKPMFDDIS